MLPVAKITFPSAVAKGGEGSKIEVGGFDLTNIVRRFSITAEVGDLLVLHLAIPAALMVEFPVALKLHVIPEEEVPEETTP